MLQRKNKKGISPLIATVLIIGFTIVLAALVITWGTKLFKDTVTQTQATSKFNLARTSGLRMEVINKALDTTNPSVYWNVTLRNNNQDTTINNFTVILNFIGGTPSEQGVITPYIGTDPSLVFPVPKTYKVNRTSSTTNFANLDSVDIYPAVNVEGNIKTCETATNSKVR